ncbi:MAD2L1-binding protein-like [Phytophthora cinnamomi]|uniref:MAD2L1-binding protein-like n=1 Tax=Phytophthora cinnamomi TaxID=4785 RepID=UPI00355A69E5|nr:MAD2L1-binding protein-like [Phytophthora cinnamomi]
MEALRVTYKTRLDGELRAAMTAQLAKYLLFMRGQIPCLYDELERIVESYRLQQQQQGQVGGNRRRLLVGGGIKKAVKCVEAAELLFDEHLDAIFSLGARRVALVFGASMMSPREAVVVDFEEVEVEVHDTSQSTTASPQTDVEDASLEDLSQTSIPPSPPMTREKSVRLCVQKLLRALHTYSLETFSRALPATKLHIALLAERQSTRIPGFLPKQHFKLRLPKDKGAVRTHHIAIYSGAGSNRSSSQEPPLAAVSTKSDAKGTTENESLVAGTHMLESPPTQLPTDTIDAGMVWYVLEKPIPGFSEAIGTHEGH